MTRSRLTGFRIAAISALTTLCATVALASAEKTIYGAENALYGRGYDVGVADGWMDDRLRTAITEFQSKNKHLKSTGNLDTATLDALEVAHNGEDVVDNRVSSQKAAASSLGLSLSSRALIALQKPQQSSEPKSERKPRTLIAETKSEPSEPVSNEARQVADVAEPSASGERDIADAINELPATAAGSGAETVEASPPRLSESKPSSAPTDKAEAEKQNEKPEPAQPDSVDANKEIRGNDEQPENETFFSRLFDLLFGWTA